uniref:tRNA/rRNA methyltransferase SpoU type domain-containing protein n=1 Tax=Timspurckia oligopyrenoides TaxID=708627 RepID=A0A7S0ZGK6_9RHOD|mmetsp:Transcript_4352/g.7639  ORF Transcript_4352/g.7639 Transcript_4352/m.7639 type:complete len:256 (+) Transcript_4352:64-831(+)
MMSVAFLGVSGVDLRSCVEVSETLQADSSLVCAKLRLKTLCNTRRKCMTVATLSASSDQEVQPRQVHLKADGKAPFGLGAAPAILSDDTDGEPLLHVVFVSPQIHWNTGNIGRTCLGIGARLHVIGPIGFSLDDKHVKRAGLDYWKFVDLRVYENWAQFVPVLKTFTNRFYFTKYAHVSMLDVSFTDSGKTVLIFGSEVDGLTSIREWLNENEDPQHMVAYPMNAPDVFRSYNLSTSASMALWEAYKSIVNIRRS